jgi:Flp pilus assembly CpaE family ATPase
LRAATRQGTLEALLEKPANQLNASSLEQILWTPEHVPRLRILAAPVISRHSPVLGSDYVRKIVRLMTACAEFVVLDLAFSSRQAVRAAVTEVNQLVLVAERTPFCLAVASQISTELFSWGVSRNAISCLIVNRSPVGVPPPIEELESQLDTSVLGVLPPDADICVKAETLRRPVITIQPEGLIAQGFDAAIRRLQARLAMRPG